MKTFVIFCLLTFVVMSNAHKKRKEATDMDDAELAADDSLGSAADADKMLGDIPFEEEAFGESNLGG